MVNRVSASEMAELIRSPKQGEEAPLHKKLSKTLKAIRTHLGMDVAFISEFSEGRRYFRYVDSARLEKPVLVGQSDPIEESYCQRIIDGRLPELILDAARLPAAQELPVTAALPVGAHLSVPIRLKNGHIYGTFCCFSFTPDYSLNDRDLGMMRVFADLSAEQIEHDVARSATRSGMAHRISDALSGDVLSMVYQPIYNIVQHTIVGFEALSRFSTVPYRAPDIWFNEAAEVGLGAELESKAMKLALADIEQLSPQGYVSVNVSPEFILRDGLATLLNGDHLQRIVLEVTEHASIAQYQDLAERIDPLRRRGLRIAVDDAGAGYASFRHILNLAPDLIKLDASITRNIDTDFSRRALATAFISFAEATQCKLIAEGVETAEELRMLQQLGVNQVQGNLLGKPMRVGCTSEPIFPE